MFMYSLHPSSLFLRFSYVFSCNIIIRAYIFAIFKSMNYLFKCFRLLGFVLFFSYNPRLSSQEENHIVLSWLVIVSTFFYSKLPLSLMSAKNEGRGRIPSHCARFNRVEKGEAPSSPTWLNRVDRGEYSSLSTRSNQEE